MADFLISDFGYANEPGALATVTFGAGERRRISAVSALLAQFSATWVPLCRVHALRNEYRRGQLPLPGDRIVCDCPDLGQDRVAVLSCRRERGRLRYRLELLGRRSFERLWEKEKDLAWRFLARFTER
jgi:hypothetical protein